MIGLARKGRMPVRNITILGSTGSIGTQTVDVVRRLGPERAQIVALTARSNVSLLSEQAAKTPTASLSLPWSQAEM